MSLDTYSVNKGTEETYRYSVCKKGQFVRRQCLQERLIRAKTVSARKANSCEDSVFVCVCVGAAKFSNCPG